MNWGSLDAFLRMGGNGGYVWGSYGAVALLVLIEVILVRARLRRARRAATSPRYSRR
jgi:heme exporter protein CcmD